MNAARTISAILSQPWMISPEFVLNNLPLIDSVLKGSFSPEMLKSTRSSEIQSSHIVKPYYDGRTGQWVIPNVQGDDNEAIMLLDIDQVIMRHDHCGDVGSVTYTSLINRASKRSDIKSLILTINSPGGMSSGTQMLAKAIADYPNPVFAFVNDGIAASAAYWIASQADKLYVSSKTDQVGSIGAYLSFLDLREYYKKEGAVLHEVYSRLSSEKNRDYLEARDGNYEKIQDSLDFLVETFIEQVKSNRQINTSHGDPFKGAMFFADEAQKIGLIDGIKSFEEVVDEIQNASSDKTRYYV